MSFVAMFAYFYSLDQLYNVLICTTPVVLFFLKPSLKFNNSITKLVAFFGVFAILALPAFLSHGTSIKLVLFSFLSFFHSIVVAYIINEKKLSYGVVSLPYFIFCLLVLFLMYANVDPGYFFPDASRNSFSWIALFGASLCCIVQYKQVPFKPSLWPVFAAFAISLWALGRSGIASTGLLLFGVILFRVKQAKNKAVFLFNSVAVLAVLLLFFGVSRGNVLLHVAARFAMENHAEDSRSNINVNYIQNMDSMGRILFGFDSKEDWYMSKFEYNYHNSFIKFHSIIGFGSLIILFFILRGVVLMGANCSIFWFMGFALLFRIGTDSAAFFGPIDPVLLFFLFQRGTLAIAMNTRQN